MDATLQELLGLPEPSEFIVFERPPLALALCQVRFARVLGVANTASVAPFQDALRDSYPLVNQTSEVRLGIQAGVGAAQVQEEHRFSRWEFADSQDTWKVVLSEDFLAIETRAYDSFSDFLERLRQASSALMDHIKPTIGMRIGLRYVNEIRTEGLGPAELIRPELLGPVAVPDLSAAVHQSLQELLLRYPEGHGLTVRHGLFPAGTTIKPRSGDAAPEGPFYLLDLDAFREFRLPNGLAMNVESICQAVEAYNRAIYRFFRWALTESYTTRMGVRRYASGANNGPGSPVGTSH